MSVNAVTSLYRRSLKLALDWAVHRHIWRGQAVYIRSLFEANKNIRDPRQQKVRDMTFAAADRSVEEHSLTSTVRSYSERPKNYSKHGSILIPTVHQRPLVEANTRETFLLVNYLTSSNVMSDASGGAGDH
ncbi:hypothetical protein AN3467.2 [Aspergillus nidulans FGSC A4]|nr:hypothetical protein AN3467.2 [Aspergillus nidulans FGSC A4]|eukprot:XP_661071.1 hypothetical protein AN3467.2 [Aspergillus nidulans FGSC A4]